MSQAFLNGFRTSSGMGMGDVRTPMMRSVDQNSTQSGNPALAYNMPRFQNGAIASGPQQMPVQQPPQAVAKPMQLRMPNVRLPGQQAPVLAQMPAQAPGFIRQQQTGQYNYPSLTSMGNGRRVFQQ
jgi:hypothetical protein